MVDLGTALYAARSGPKRPPEVRPQPDGRDGGASDPQAQLQDCGHVGRFAGVCQYDGCAKQLCPDCFRACAACGKVLCRTHQVAVTDELLFCPADAKRYLVKRLVLRALGRG